MSHEKRIGIWGLGVVGISALKHFASRGYTIEVMDKKEPSQETGALLAHHSCTFVLQDDVINFLARHTHIVASPGIDLRPYQEHTHKWITELDIIQHHYPKPIFAITGSVGKTTVTHLLGHLLNTTEFPVWVGGNIGTGMLDLLREQESYQAAVLELSSFQLELCTTFAPRLAIWTNFYANHLDRHGTLENYFQAKKKIIMHQTACDMFLVPFALKSSIGSFIKSARAFFLAEPPSAQQISQLMPHEKLYFLEHSEVFLHYNGNNQHLASLNDLPPITFAENWLIVISALHLLARDLTKAFAAIDTLQIPKNRLEHVATLDGIAFYNDSKSTHPISTLAACAKICSNAQTVHLLLGGLSKGVDRTDLLKQLKESNVRFYMFGHEAEQLKKMCAMLQIPCTAFTNLDDAFAACVQNAKSHDAILLSPAGSSYDLYKDYQERGLHFKKLVDMLKK